MPKTISDPHYLTYKDVCGRYNIGTSTLYRWIEAEKFPAGVFMGNNSRRWSITVLKTWEKHLNQGGS